MNQTRSGVRSFGFSKAKQIVKTDEISSVFSFNSRFSSEHFQVLVKPGMRECARMAVIVSKKTARLATSRNYIKRVAREVFRLQQARLESLDFVIRICKSFDRAEFAEIEQELITQLDRARQKFTTPEKQNIL